MGSSHSCPAAEVTDGLPTLDANDVFYPGCDRGGLAARARMGRRLSAPVAARHTHVASTRCESPRRPQTLRCKVVAAAHSDLRAKRLAHDAASLAFGVACGLRREVGPSALAVLLLVMGLGMMDIRVAAVAAEFSCSKQFSLPWVLNGQTCSNNHDRYSVEGPTARSRFRNEAEPGDGQDVEDQANHGCTQHRLALSANGRSSRQLSPTAIDSLGPDELR
eukprot:COSAG04_NODE_684_length_11170_cov_4.232228_2_plen_220_part_00